MSTGHLEPLQNIYGFLHLPLLILVSPAIMSYHVLTLMFSRERAIMVLEVSFPFRRMACAHETPVAKPLVQRVVPREMIGD